MKETYFLPPEVLESLRRGHFMPELKEKSWNNLQQGLKEFIQDSYELTPFHQLLENLDFSLEEVTPQVSHQEMTLHLKDGAEIMNSVPGVKVKGLRESKIPLEIQDLLNSENHRQKTPLSAVHRCLMENAFLIEINEPLESPLIIRHLITKKLTAPLVFIKSKRKATVIEETFSELKDYQAFRETYLLPAENSTLEHILLSQENSKAHHFILGEIPRNATLRSFLFHLSGTRTDLTLNLNEEGAHADSFSLALTDQKERSDFFTQIHHLRAHTTSAQLCKGIFADESRGVFTGRIFIHPKAQQVSSSQLNKNLLLSPKAQAHSRPQLEIFADDVKCSHGSTTGELSQEELFYFKSRGIPELKAKALLSQGFAEDVVNKITHPEARSLIKKIISKALSQKFSLGSPS